MKADRIEMWPVRDLREDPDNPRTAGYARSGLRLSIEQEGVQELLYVRGTPKAQRGIVVDGNQRLACLRDLGRGDESVRCIVLYNYTEDEIARLRAIIHQGRSRKRWDVYDQAVDMQRAVNENGWSVQDAARAVGIAPGRIDLMLRALPILRRHKWHRNKMSLVMKALSFGINMNDVDRLIKSGHLRQGRQREPPG